MNDAHDWRHRRANAGRDPLSGDTPEMTGPVDWPTEAGDGAPVDLSQVAFDDRFLDALSRDVPVETRDDGEYELAALLSGWRHGALDAPPPELPSVDEVERAIAASERVSRGKRMVRHLRVVSGAAAIVVVAAAGLTVLSEGSQPGDALWPVKRVVFAQAASETQAAHDVRSNLESAEAAMAAGDTVAASSLIAKAESEMGPMRDGDKRKEMNDWIARLRAGTGKATETNVSTSPSAPGSGTTSPNENTTSPDPRLRTRSEQQMTPPGSTDNRSTAPQTTPPPSGPVTTEPSVPPTRPTNPTTSQQQPVPTTTTTSYTVTVPTQTPPPASTDVPTVTTTTTVPSR